MRPYSLRHLQRFTRLGLHEQPHRYASWWRRREHSGYPVQQVYLKKPSLSPRRFLFLSMYFAGGYFYMAYLSKQLTQLDEHLGEWEEPEEHEHEVDEDGNLIRGEQDNDSWFIPMQYPERLPRVMYRQSDPEWQEFVKISWDEQRKATVREELASRVAREAGGHAYLKMKLGKDIKHTKYWFDIKFPDGPPPEYARKGIEIADDYIAWSTQVIPHSHYIQLSHVLWPRAAFSAARFTLSFFYHLQAARIKTQLGHSLSAADKGALRWARWVAMSTDASEENSAGGSGSTSTNARSTSPSSRTRTTPAVPPSGDTDAHGILGDPRPNPAASSSSAATPQHSLATSTLGLPRSARPVSDILVTAVVFLNAFMNAQGETKTDVEPPGCFFVFGQVEIMGSTGRCKIDVRASYDPKTSNYRHVDCKVQHLWELKQGAKGGP